LHPVALQPGRIGTARKNNLALHLVQDRHDRQPLEGRDDIDLILEDTFIQSRCNQRSSGHTCSCGWPLTTGNLFMSHPRTAMAR
jgi:hypothetical protein